ncbi:MAG: hypothetical protein ABJF10_11060 [Chthoniobacter sp.]|uniref:hypothetical protein n=1 Tax=Chthoniobacter sp. TaxID=2510640 RepID=UPI0032AB0E33
MNRLRSAKCVPSLCSWEASAAWNSGITNLIAEKFGRLTRHWGLGHYYTGCGGY